MRKAADSFRGSLSRFWGKALKSYVWIPSGIMILTGFGFAVAKTTDLVASQAPKVGAQTQMVEFVPPSPDRRIGVAYRKNGDNAFSDVAVATVEPFDDDGDGIADSLSDGIRSHGDRSASGASASGPLRVSGAVAFSAGTSLGSRAVLAASDMLAQARAHPAKPSSTNTAVLRQVVMSAKAPGLGAKPVDPEADDGQAGDAEGHDVSNVLDGRAWQSTHFADNPLVGNVFTADGKRSSEDAMMGAAEGSRYLLLGEIHDNPDHHRIQADIIGGLAKLGHKSSVVFEMIPQKYADTLAAFEASENKDLEALADSLKWSERGWPDFSIYRPIFEAALDDDLPIRAGDLDNSVIGAIARDGVSALSSEDVERLGLDAPLSAAETKDLSNQIREAHCGLMPEGAIVPMGLVQRARDGELADALIKASKATGSAILVSGSGHARTDRGVPAVLAKRDPSGKSVAVQMVEVAQNEDRPGDYGLSAGAPAPYDFTIFTPRNDVSDHCAALRASMGDAGKSHVQGQGMSGGQPAN